MLISHHGRDNGFCFFRVPLRSASIFQILFWGVQKEGTPKIVPNSRMYILRPRVTVRKNVFFLSTRPEKRPELGISLEVLLSCIFVCPSREIPRYFTCTKFLVQYLLYNLSPHVPDTIMYSTFSEKHFRGNTPT